MGRAARALAHGSDDLVLSGVKRLLLGRLSLELKLTSVRSGALSKDGLGSAERRSIRGNNNDNHLTGGNGGLDLVNNGNRKGRALSTLTGGDPLKGRKRKKKRENFFKRKFLVLRELSNVSRGSRAVGAQVDALANVNRVGISLLQQLGELLNSGNLANFLKKKRK